MESYGAKHGLNPSGVCRALFSQGVTDIRDLGFLMAGASLAKGTRSLLVQEGLSVEGIQLVELLAQTFSAQVGGLAALHSFRAAVAGARAASA